MSLAVSVIIPTYNRAEFVNEAIASVLAQTYAPVEILVVDDGSTDETAAVVRGFGARVQYLYQVNRGPAAARNVGILQARGDALAFLDSDDLWVPQALDWCVARLEDESAPRVDLAAGLSQQFQRVLATDGERGNEPVLPLWAILSFCTMLSRRAVFARVGLIDESLRYGEDVDWFLRVREQNIPFAFLDRVTHLRRLHENNLMNDTRAANLYMLQVLKKSLARRARNNDGNVSALAELPNLEMLRKMVYGAV